MHHHPGLTARIGVHAMEHPEYSTTLPTASTKGCVYRATCVVNGKVYVGKSVHGLVERRKSHFGKSKRGSKLYFHCALRRWGPNNFYWEELYLSNDEDSLLVAEALAILSEKASGAQLYNLTRGGEDNPANNPATKAKISSALKAYYSSAEARQASSARGKEIFNTPGKRASMAAYGRERWQCPEYRARMTQQALTLWQNPEFAQQQVLAARQRKEDPAFVENLRAKAVAQWSDPEWKTLEVARRHAARQAKKLATTPMPNRYRKPGAERN